MKYKNNKQKKYKNISCPGCNSKNITKRGYFQTEAHGKQQRYFCKNCNKKFIKRTPFYRMRNSSQKITLCLDLFYRGVSTRKVQEHLQAFYPKNSSWVSIYSWVVKYTKIISKFTDGLKLEVGSEVQVDELEYHRRKYHQKGKGGTEENWFIDSVDPKTKFMVSSNYVKSRSKKEIKRVLLKIKEKTGKQVKIITTDGLTAYENVVKKTFGYNNKLGKYNVYHNKVVTSKEDRFNYPIERLHNSVRARTKTFRSFHGSLESANAIMKGYEIYYNFITKHQAINCCPYELATDLELRSLNKWLELIELSQNDM